MDDLNELTRLMSLLANTGAPEKRKAADELMSGLGSDDSRELKKILNDRGKIEEILRSEAAKNIIKKLGGSSIGQHQ